MARLAWGEGHGIIRVGIHIGFCWGWGTMCRSCKTRACVSTRQVNHTIIGQESKVSVEIN